MSCEHDFKHIETLYKTNYKRYGDTQYERVDRFFCSKCLESAEARKVEYSRTIPSWYKDVKK